MDAHRMIAWLIIGVIAGWLSGQIMRGQGFGLVGDIIVGLFGALLGGWFAGVFGISAGNGFMASIITAAIGAVILILAFRVLQRT